MSRLSALVLLVLLVPALVVAQSGKPPDLVAEVRAVIATGDIDRAEALLVSRRAGRAPIPEDAAAVSWLARASLGVNQLDRASRYAADAKATATAILGPARLQDGPLAIAIGAAIEVQAQVLAARGDRAAALDLLADALEAWADTPIHKRIQKNTNLIGLEGQPTPPLEAVEVLGPPVPSREALKGKVVAYFFWAHWCPDCKIQGPILERLLAKYAAEGFAVIAPTQRYGYGARGVTLGPEDELKYIVSVQQQYYPFLAGVPAPVSEANHKQYGVSTTPTLVLADRNGIVRLYHPGRMTEEELDGRIRGLLGVAPASR